MSQTILTTVGTSVLTNSGWKFKQPLPAASAVDDILATAKPIEASAELHTWYRLGLFDLEEPKRTEVVLIHSQTPEGLFCAERLVQYAATTGLRARRRQVDGLDYVDGQRFNRGLRQLARVIGEEIKRARLAGSVELAATGGFKAEIAIANLVGAMSETPVHYIYQEFSSLITIDPIPVTLRNDWIGSGAGRKLLEAFDSADDLVSLTTIESLLRQDERLLTLVEIDGHEVGLTLLGEIALQLLGSPGDTWPPATDTDPDNKIHFDSAAHHRPDGWKQVTNTVARCRFVTFLRYEGNISGGCLKDAADNESDLIHRIEGSPSFTFRICTTATNAGQRRLVRHLLLKELKL